MVRQVATELNEAFAGARLRALRLDGQSRDLILLFRERTLLWRLHPTRGYPLLHASVEPEATDLRLRGRVRRVVAPSDERVIRFELLPERRGTGAFDVIVELLGNQWNAFVTEGPDATIRHVLKRREGARPAQVGGVYVPPPPTDRMGAHGPVEVAQWVEVLQSVPEDVRATKLVRTFAWTSPINAVTILAAEPDDPSALRTAHGRWVEITHGSTAQPVLLETPQGSQPYPFPLIGSSYRGTDSLLRAFEEHAGGDVDAGDAPIALGIAPELVEQLVDALRHEARRVARLEAELAGLEDPEALRATGDLILANFVEIPTGAADVVLTDFSGDTVRVDLDPALRPHENASRYYDRAARCERAAARLPDLIDQARAFHARLEELRARVGDGTARATDVQAALPKTRPKRGRGDQPPALPYRTFRSSGGLEIRVGRGSRHNDDLTFRHSAPRDVWLHARHTAGAHVILRWHGPGNPPARDLEEAGVLAALHSKARTSSSVAVDWTLRKYVRKPRGSAPGSVQPDRVQTLFVQPDASLLGSLTERE